MILLFCAFSQVPQQQARLGQDTSGHGAGGASPQLPPGRKVWDKVQGGEREAAVQGFIVK